MLERILLAVDQSEHARKAVAAALELARAGGGTVYVLHAQEVVLATPGWSTTASRRPSGWWPAWSRSCGRPG